MAKNICLQDDACRFRHASQPRFNFNLDKLKICFRQPEGLFEKLSEHNNDYYRVNDEITLRLIKDKEITALEDAIYWELEDWEIDLETCNEEDYQAINEKREQNVSKLEKELAEKKKLSPIIAQVILTSEGDLLFGELLLPHPNKFKKLCWLTVENRALYKNYTADGAYSYVYYLNALAYELELWFNNITKLEICCDATFNFLYHTRRLIRDSEHFDMIFNGKNIENPSRKIDNYVECYSRSRDRLFRTPTLYFAGAMKPDAKLRIYNKSVEIADNAEKKEYIKDYNDFGKRSIFRAELTLTNTDIKEAWKKFTSHLPDEAPMKRPDGVVIMLDDFDFLRWIWKEYVDRVIRFRDKRTQKAVTLYDFIRDEE